MSTEAIIQLGILLGTMIGSLGVCGQILINRFDRISTSLHERLDRMEKDFRYNYVTKEVHERDIHRIDEQLKNRRLWS